MNAFTRAADALAVTPLLNCLLREAADPADAPDAAGSLSPAVSPSGPPGDARGGGPGAVNGVPAAVPPDAPVTPAAPVPVARAAALTASSHAPPAPAAPLPEGRPSPAERSLPPPPSPALPALHTIHRLRATGRLLRVRAGRHPSAPELWTGRGWRPLPHAGLVSLAAQEMRAATGRPNRALPAEMAASRAAVEAVLAARAHSAPPEDPWLRSEQALVMGHPFHPAPKARSGGGPPAAWLRYAPEAYARFPLVLLGVREDAVVEDGDTRALDVLGEAPPGYRLLPAHPWQLELAAGRPEMRAAFADGRLIRLGHTARQARPTASVRTVYVPGESRGQGGPGRREGPRRRVGARRPPVPVEPRPPGVPSPAAGDLFLKFSLDVQITNDVRRMRRHELVHVRRTDPLVTAAFAAMGGPAAWLSERCYRTVDGLFETCAVLVRDGLSRHLLPGTTAVLAAALAEGFDGNPLDRITDPLRWWTAYVRCVVPPVLEAFARYGVVVECHLQNTLIAVDPRDTPVQAVFRDAEGAKALDEIPRAPAWRRLAYCLVVNNLSEIAGALAHRFPWSGTALWDAARDEFERFHALPGLPALPEIGPLLASSTLPGKANLLSRWIGADGTDPRYLPVPNPLATHSGHSGASSHSGASLHSGGAPGPARAASNGRPSPSPSPDAR
ncbi:IucA/IucC family protein [Streptomyces sp. URMC 126]|uniref:IucA/IucC family protein n=1 Tax=Streptomyces sp. URMC 126 TaxID=3423401 RepID=UPI003F1CEC6A